MGNKARLWISLLIIVVLSWIELQFFTESVGVEEMKRKVAHILFLLAVGAVGYFAWAKHPVQWIKSVWLLGYAVALVIILGVGIIQWKFGVFGTAFLDEIHHIRLFFNSPLPFIMLLAAPKRFKKENVPSGSAK
ncbi:MAG: hypothetical protein EOP56_12515 [Sphingobacteriales bacterium]|nr:MAG: hypothetical protein EOP56_12515 [Sphingobacteriales bacterium]